MTETADDGTASMTASRGTATLEHGWLYDHIGRLMGVVLVTLALVGLTVLAALGVTAALGILVFVFGGILLIILGGKVHRA